MDWHATASQLARVPFLECACDSSQQVPDGAIPSPLLAAALNQAGSTLEGLFPALGVKQREQVLFLVDRAGRPLLPTLIVHSVITHLYHERTPSMSRGFGTNSETLLFLAWATRVPGLLNQLKQSSPNQHERLLTRSLERTLPPDLFDQDTLYGPLFQSLFTYRLKQVSFEFVSWALRGFESVHFKQVEDQPTENSLMKTHQSRRKQHCSGKPYKRSPACCL